MLIGLPRHWSASRMFAEARTDDFHAVMRKRVASLMMREGGSENFLVTAVADTNDNSIFIHRIQARMRTMDTKGLCSGSILNSMTILTAAHCFNKFSRTFAIKHYNNKHFDKIADVTQYGVIKHPEYRSKLMNRDVDLAIMKTEENMEFNENVQPIALAFSRGVKIFDRAVIVGFGRADPTGKPSGREGYVTVTRCPSKYLNVICTSGYVRAASGDSGGALVYRNQLVGVTSGSCLRAENLIISEPCLTVYANVTANMDWIKSHLDDLTTTEISIATTDNPRTSSLPSPSKSECLQEPNSYSPTLKTTTVKSSTIYRIGEKSVYSYLPIHYDEEDMIRTTFTYIFIL
ncbi:trypsin theta-like [Hyposmocoma kahamanoa]|uniref:trypsin theta-like n=1 Tax=Hyposmocoma kahamanoa TaxID=1477025 RepID=UPI000E6D8A3F|nr:trypsin theta-like [Hyposmocoma kahamanoa]